jgi:hypothetical protein
VPIGRRLATIGKPRNNISQISLLVPASDYTSPMRNTALTIRGLGGTSSRLPRRTTARSGVGSGVDQVYHGRPRRRHLSVDLDRIEVLRGLRQNTTAGAINITFLASEDLFVVGGGVRRNCSHQARLCLGTTIADAGRAHWVVTGAAVIRLRNHGRRREQRETMPRCEPQLICAGRHIRCDSLPSDALTSFAR